jgi:hypothetical protein
MYSARKRERRRILAQGCKKLSHGLGVSNKKLINVEDYSMIFKLHGKRRYNAKKMKDEGESLLLSFKSMYASG